MAMMISILAMALAAAPAQAGPIYVTCTLQDGDTAQLVDLTVDEADQSVTINQKTTGRVVGRRAIFSPTEVRVLDQESTWVVSRVDLSLQRISTFSDKQFVDHGSCKVAQTPAKRAF